ncbi:TPA: hypothetical protein ACRR48_001481 [Klebsiella quasipneumoniae]
MSKSTITRERAQQIFLGNGPEPSASEERELARMVLAVMDSEPVAWTDEEELRDVNVAGIGYLFGIDREANKFADPRRQIMLYRHAQPVPVVSADLLHSAASAIEDLLTTKDRTGAGVWFDLPFRLRSAANAQPAQVVPEEATPDSIEILASGRCRDHVVYQWDEDQRNAAADSWNAFRAAMLQELKKSAGTEAICRSDENVQVLHTKSPAKSDCFPEQNGVAPAQSPIDHGYRPECECSGCKATARICAELSANSPANPDCWCRTCRPVVLNDMRFVVCPDCGNKRCPRANDHRNSCTGSNEPGQEGSAYPDTPQEVNHD